MTAQALRVEELAAPYFVAPQLSDQLDTFACAPEGFKRLRELVLNLAVRGRLVPQDPSDEPADILVESRSGLSGPNHQPASATIDPLPSGWVLASLSALGVFCGGKTPSTSHSGYWDGSIPWVTPKDMKSNEIYDTQDHVSELALRDGLNAIEANCVLIVVRSGILRRMLPVAICRTRCTVNQDLKALRLRRPEMARYVQLMLQGYERWILVALTKTGTTVESVKTDELAECLFPLPPLAEQSRIVAKVEELMALIDRLEKKVSHGDTARGKLLDALLAALADSPDAAATADAWAQLAPHFDLLFQTSADVDRLQQTLLTLAVKGRLVPQDPNDEPAAELLKRIRAEKQRLVAGGTIKRETPFAEISDSEKPYSLPHGWQWVRLNQLLSKIGAGSTPLGGKEVYVSSGVKFLRSQNVWNEGLRLTDTAYVKPETHEKMSGTKVLPNDLLFNITGASIGRCAVVPESIGEANVSQHVTIVRPVQREIVPLLHLVLISSHVQQTVMDVQVGVSREGLSISKLGKFVIPLPPLAEQSRIVAAVASLTALCDRLRKHLAVRRDLSAKLATALTESALQ